MSEAFPARGASPRPTETVPVPAPAPGADRGGEAKGASAGARAPRTRSAGARRAAVTASLTYGVLLAGSGILTPYFPLWLQARGFSATEIGVLLSLPMLMRVIASTPIAKLGDGWLGPRRTFLLTALGTALFFLALTPTSRLGTVAALLLLASAFLAPTAPLLDTIVLEGVVRHGHDYGRIRQWGSFAWLLASLAGGVLFQVLPRETIPPVLGLLYAGTALVGLSLPDDRKQGRLATAEREDGSSPSWALFGLLAASIACLQGAHAFLYTFGTVIWQRAGFTSGAVGGLWATGVVVETTAFLLAGWAASRFNPYTLMMIGGVAGLVRWLAMGAGPEHWAVLAGLQGLHGLSFAAVHLGTMRWLARYQQGRAGRQGMANAATGVGLIIGTLASGPLYQAFGVHGFFVMAMVTLLGMGLVAATRRRDRDEQRTLQPQSSEAGGTITLPR